MTVAYLSAQPTFARSAKSLSIGSALRAKNATIIDWPPAHSI
jgi:hypothetical protein